MDLEGIDAEEQIFAKRTGLDHRLEVPVSCADDAGIDMDDLVVPDASQIAAFEHSEQFGLHSQWEFADFIEENRPSIGSFEEPLSVQIRTGECTFDVTEQFALDKVFWQSAAVDGNKRLVATQAFLVHGAGDKFFAASGLAADQDRARRRRDARDQFGDRLHRFGVSDDLSRT
jgi:hypothetical protein